MLSSAQKRRQGSLITRPETTIPVRITPEIRALAEVPRELEWFQNIRKVAALSSFRSGKAGPTRWISG